MRANLISLGRTGNCATVRRVTVTAEATAAAGPPPPPACLYSGEFSSGTSQLGRIFRDAIPSTCAGKAYPGIFNP